MSDEKAGELERVKAAWFAQGGRQVGSGPGRRLGLTLTAGPWEIRASCGGAPTSPWIGGVFDVRLGLPNEGPEWTGNGASADAMLAMVEERIREDIERMAVALEAVGALRRELVDPAERAAATERWLATLRAHGAEVVEYRRGVAELRRRIEAGEPDDVLDVERERLADEWYRLTDDERDVLRRLIAAQGGAR